MHFFRNGIVLFLALVCGGASNAAAAETPKETLKIEYKNSLKDAGKGAIEGSCITKGTVKYAQEPGAHSSGILRLMTGKDYKEYWLGFNIKVPKEKIKELKNNSLLFKIYVKRINGSGTFSITMRNFQDLKKEWKLVSSSDKKTELQGDKWELLQFSCRIPEMAEVDMVDFQVGVMNPPPDFECLVDEPSLEIAAANNTSFETAFMGNAPNQEPLVLVKDGKPMATIVTEAKPTECVKYAVKEFNEHFELCTGTALPVVTEDKKVEGTVIHIGKTALSQRFCLEPDKLTPDSWLVRRVNNAIIISGGDNKFNLPPSSKTLAPFGTLYATYEFLERQLGVRWYQPGKLGIITPKNPNVSIGNINWEGLPSYNTRFAFYADPDDKEISNQESIIWWRRMRWGGIGGSPIGMHSFNTWIERFAGTHPEYFAIQADGNPKTKAGGEGGHVCFSKPEVLKQTVLDKQEIFDKTKWQMFSPVMPGDSDGLYYCRCKECTAKIKFGQGPAMRSNEVWSFVNKVAAELRKSHPERFITCCAYSSYLIPPDFALEPNVAVTLCIGSPEIFFKGDAKNNYVAKIQSWQKTGASLYIWDYWNDPRYYKGIYGAPAIYPHLIKELFFLDYGRVQGHVIELSNYNCKGEDVSKWADWRYDSLNIYVAMKLLWDMNQDVDKIVDEYCTVFYGPAAPVMKKFYAEMEAAYMNPNTKNGPDFKWDWEACWIKTYPPEFMEKMMGCLREAVKLTAGQEPYNARTRKLLEAYKPFEDNCRMFNKAGAKTERNISVPAVSQAPAIDGELNDECWKSAPVTEEFCDSFGLYDLKSKTNVKLACDKEKLYIGITAVFPKGSPLHMNTPANSRDGFVWNDESCEIFLTQDNKLYQFLIGPDNVLMDLFNPDSAKEAKLDEAIKWNCEGIVYKTLRKDDRWTAELAIPLKSIALKSPTKENPWKVNFCRNYFYILDEKSKTWKNELSAWSPTYGSFHNVNRFGNMYFSK